VLEVLQSVLGTALARRIAFGALLGSLGVAVGLLVATQDQAVGIAAFLFAVALVFVAALVLAQLGATMKGRPHRKKRGQVSGVINGQFRGGALRFQPGSAWDALEMGEESFDPEPFGDEAQLAVFVAVRVDIDQIKRDLIVLRREQRIE